MNLSFEHISKLYGNTAALQQIDLTLGSGVYGLLGPNGAGKTTLMRIMTDLLAPSTGRVLLDGQDIAVMGAAFRKKLGYLPQDFGVYPNFTAEQFLLYIARLKGLSKFEAKRQTDGLLHMVGLEDKKQKKLKGFSGGQRQRVAFARALAPNPQVLLLDEPFAAIDAKVRTELRTWLKEMVTKLGITSIFVTHDQDEAVEVADEIIITNHGRIEQMGTPMEIYKAPDTPFVAQFIGRSSVVNEYDRLCGFDRIEGADHAVLRPEFVKLSRSEPERFISATEEGFVKDIVFRGNHLDIVVDIDGIEIVAERSLEKDPLEIGQKVYVLIYRLYIFDEHQTYLVENQEMQVDDVFYI